MMASWDASDSAPWRSRRARMLRRRRTLSVYAASAPIGSVFFTSSSTAHCAKARAWATVRLQDRGVWVEVDICEGTTNSDVRIMLVMGEPRGCGKRVEGKRKRKNDGRVGEKKKPLPDL